MSIPKSISGTILGRNNTLLQKKKITISAVLGAFLLTHSLFINATITEIPSSTFDYQITSDGKFVIYLTKSPSKLIVIGDNYREFDFSQIDMITDIDPDPQLTVSPNNYYATVSFTSGETERIVKVISFLDMQLIFETKATSSVWTSAGYSLIFIPMYDFDELQQTHGIRIFSTEHNCVFVYANEYLFTGRVRHGGKFLVADIMDTSADRPRFRTIKISLDLDSFDSDDCENKK